MDITSVIEVISTIGFPITMVLGMGYFVYQLWKQSVVREEKLMSVNSEAINTLSKYAEKLTVIENTVDEIKKDIQNLSSTMKE